MTRIRLVVASLFHYRRANLAVLAGAAVGAAVLTGALVVGDSIRFSLRALTLERLGAIDEALVAQRIFRGGLAEDIAAAPEFAARGARAIPAMVLRGSVEHADTAARAGRVGVTGVEPDFWELDGGALAKAGADLAALGAMKGFAAALNESLAREVGAKVGDSVLLRLDRPTTIPAEAVHGRREERVETLRLKVAAVLPDRGLARFSLFASQQAPFNIFVPLETLRRRFEREDGANAVLVSFGGDGEAEPIGGVPREALTVEDLGLRIRIDEARGRLSVESERMTLNDAEGAAIRAASDALGLESAPTLTYLANRISLGDRSIPYSTVSALGPFRDGDSRVSPASAELAAVESLADDEIVLNDWAAEDLGAKVGDEIALTYFVEGPGGRLDTETTGGFHVAAIVPVRDAAGAPTAFVDPGLTPDYPGIADAESMNDWDPPFPLDLAAIRDKDEAYWDEFRATPKAFVSLGRAIDLWSGRFGSLTSVRARPATGEGATGAARADDLADFAAKLGDAIVARFDPGDAGLVLRPVKAEGLAASAGATDFAGLFFGFSMFVIGSAALLVRLLFALSVESRAREAGLLLATGFRGRAVRRMFLLEGGAIAVVGSFAGAAAGLGYAALMLHGLRTWWVGAVGTNLLFLHATPASLIGGAVAGTAVALASVFFAVRAIAKAQPARLLAGGAWGNAFARFPDRRAGSARNPPARIVNSILESDHPPEEVRIWSAEAMPPLSPARPRLAPARETVSFDRSERSRARAWSAEVPGDAPDAGAGHGPADESGGMASALQISNLRGEATSLARDSAGILARRAKAPIVSAVFGALAVACVGAGPFVGSTARAGLFFGGGACALVAALAGISIALARGATGAIRPGAGALARLGFRNAARAPGRSLATIALTASATFTIVAVAANRADVREAPIRRDAPNGGFALMAEADAPLLADPNDPAAREELFPNVSAREALDGVRFARMRASEGQDASCLNLYRPDRPRVLGAPPEFVARGGFRFQASLAQTSEERANPWRLLERPDPKGDAAPGGVPALPAIADFNTAMWILKSGLGKTVRVEDGGGREVELRLVALLAGSALQGELIVSEENFLRLHPETSGWRDFFVEFPEDASAERVAKVAELLEAELAPYGFDVFRTQDRIAAFLTVQNTYLSTFLALGGLGLLLGTLGLGAAMVRNVAERSGELALLRALGYRGGAVAATVVWENALLLTCGLAAGAAAALLAVAPTLANATANAPWGGVAATLAAVFATGALAGLAAARAAARLPILGALRGR